MDNDIFLTPKQLFYISNQNDLYYKGTTREVEMKKNLRDTCTRGRAFRSK